MDGLPLRTRDFNDTHPMNPLTRITGALAAGALALMSLAGCDD